MLLPSLPSSRPACATTLVASSHARQRLVHHHGLVERADLVGEEAEGLLGLAHARDVLGDRHGAQDDAVVHDRRRGEHDGAARAVEPLDVHDHVREGPPVLERLRRRPVLGLQPLAGLRPECRVRLELVDRVHRPLAGPDLAEDVVAQQHLTIRGDDAEADRSGLDDGAQPRRLPGQRLLDAPLLADVAEGGHHTLHLAVLRPDDPGMHVGPDVVPVLVPVADLALERSLAQDVLAASRPRWSSGMAACSRSSLCRPIASSRVQPNSSLRRLVPEDHAELGVGGADGVVDVGQQVRLQGERGLRLLARVDVREHGERGRRTRPPRPARDCR